METTVSTRPRRSLARRIVAPWGLSLAILSGGGWGAYHYVCHTEVAPPEGEYVGTSSTIAAHSASVAKDELKNLFATEPSTANSEKSPASKKLIAQEVADRYAPTVVMEVELSLPPEQPRTSPSRLADRYVSAPTPPPNVPAPKSENPPQPMVPDESVASEDVTRGQEPNHNPLRSALNDKPAVDAQAIFGPDDGQASPVPAVQPLVAQPGGATARSTNQDDALQRARPLEPARTSDPPSFDGDRYYGGGNTNLGGQLSVNPDANSAPRRPLPPIGMNEPSSSLGASTAIASPLRNDITPTPGLANNAGTGRPGERLLEGVQSPSISIQKLAPENIQVGRRCTYAIRVQNTGQRTAQNVKIYDEVPLGTELLGTAPKASVSGTQVAWDMGTLSVGEERTVEMEVVPREEGELGSVATVTFAAQASAKARCTKPELALRLSSGPEVLMGNQHVVQVEVSNPGSGVATGVMLLESVPPGVSHEVGPALEFEIGTLRPGDSRRLELLLTAEKAGKINNVMTALADAGLQVQSGCEFEVIAPELRLSVEGPHRRYLERPATYHVSVENPGTATAKDVQLVTRLPKGLQFVSANNMGEYDTAEHSVYWSLAELPANERGTVELVTLPIESGQQTLKLATKAREGLEDRTEKQVVVEGLSALMFEVVDVEGLIEVGGDTTYEIRLTNQGSKDATNVKIVALMQPGIRALSGQGDTPHTIQGDRVIFSPLPQLAPKADTTFRIQAQGVHPGNQRVRVQVTADDLQQPITKEVNTRVYADE